ncbi:MAG: hypothetical protein LBT51_10025 [Fusobacteriaceae bacterium]|nr:hypothetical protein [Fusobacteriaceae bacterium]
MDDYSVFLKYFGKKFNNFSNCIKNHKDKRFVFNETIDGEIYFIKKYSLTNRRGIATALKIREDKADHYAKISKKLMKIGVSHAEPLCICKKRFSLLKIESLLITKYCGVTIDKYIDKFKEHIDKFKCFYNIFIKLTQNKIYIEDYNFGGMTFDNDSKYFLLDLDEYRIKLVLTSKYKQYMILKLWRNCAKIREKNEEFYKFASMEVRRVVKELGWEKEIHIDDFKYI